MAMAVARPVSAQQRMAFNLNVGAGQMELANWVAHGSVSID